MDDLELVRIENVAIEKYPSLKNWQSGSKFGVCSDIHTAYFDAEIGAVQAKAEGHIKVLEIGFGNGEFAGYCRLKQFEYTGTEIIDSQIVKARSAGFNVYEANDAFEYLSRVGCNFDLIVAFDVIEHLDHSSIISLLKCVRPLLARNAHLIFRFPSGDSPFARPLQYGDLTHRSVLAGNAMRQIAELSGYRLVALREPQFVYRKLRFASLLRRAVIQVVRSVVFKVLRICFYANDNVVLTQNCIAVLAIDENM